MVRPPMGQCRPATGAPNLNKASPIRAMVGAMVIGPTKRSSLPMSPVAPMTISQRAPRMIAPWTCCMRTSHPSLARAAMPQMAKVGARKEKVPPCTMGRRLPQVTWSRVVMPLTKNIVAISQPSSTGSVMPRGWLMISGMASVDPNIVR